jgi:hypothetical protein
MKVILIALCTVSSAAAVHAEGSHMKPGLWERHTLKVATDNQNVLPQMNVAHKE